MLAAYLDRRQVRLLLLDHVPRKNGTSSCVCCCDKGRLHIRSWDLSGDTSGGGGFANPPSSFVVYIAYGQAQVRLAVGLSAINSLNSFNVPQRIDNALVLAVGCSVTANRNVALLIGPPAAICWHSRHQRCRVARSTPEAGTPPPVSFHAKKGVFIARLASTTGAASNRRVV